MAEKNISCPHCGQELSIEEQYLGMEVECPTCRKSFTAGSPTTETAPQAEEAVFVDDVEEAGPDLKDKFREIHSGIMGKLDEIQREENERFNVSDTLELSNRIRNGGIYRKLWQLIIPAVTISLLIVCAVINLIFGGVHFAAVPFFAAISFLVGSMVSRSNFSSTKEKTYTKITREKLASQEQLERKKIAKLFSDLKDSLQPVSKKSYQLWCETSDKDQEYLKQLDVLPRFGKSEKQLIAESHTLFSPDIYVFRLDENSNFLYPRENVTKLYTFEDQLFIFSAVWDYTTGNLFDESTSAFFFNEICDISTSTNYADSKNAFYTLPTDIKVKPFSLNKTLITAAVLFPISLILCLLVFNSMEWVKKPFLFAISVSVFLTGGLIAILCSSFDLNCLKKIIPQKNTNKTKIKQSETFTITARSGKSTGITIVCDEWIEANNGNFTRRNNAEQIIHAIRKMIEEKKVAAK
ncbi:MAG: hypothetical protein IJS01_04935 [Lentisphaeria bacterium]|nr:hypothetical protein [Lentisphaeria bacterium]